MVKFRVNSKEYDNAVKEALKKVSDLRPVFIQIAREFYKANRAIFTLKSAGKYVDFTGKKIRMTWSPDRGRPSARTRNGDYTVYQWNKERKTGLKRGYPLLKYSGRLEKSITQQGSGEAITEITKKSVILGSAVPYGVFHQYGTKVLPMRQFLFVDPATTIWNGNVQFSRRNEAWVKAIDTFVARSMKSMGDVKGATNG